MTLCWSLVIQGSLLAEGATPPPDPNDLDPRNIIRGYEIPDESYCDQPYIVVMQDGTWVCMLTTAPGGESSVGQHVVATTSKDRGKTWSPLVDIESGDGPHASWVVPLLTPSGRLYAIYTYNGDEAFFGRGKQYDAQHGWYVFKYSDDAGQTWSQRHRIPLRRTACDQSVIDGHIVQMFWGVAKPQIVDNEVFISFSKLGEHYMRFGEGWILHSHNILTEKDPEKIHWQLLPDGDHGIRHPEFGSVQEEHILLPLNQKGGFACVFRTGQGMPAIAYSYDGCRTWELPERMRYATGQPMRTPRACPMFWKTKNGRYLFWFHNNAGETWFHRNPAWISAGIERDGKIFWSQPEILIYGDSSNEMMSYPDLIEIDGRYWVSETNKEVARVREVDGSLFEGAWQTLSNQLDSKKTTVIEKGLIYQTSERSAVFPPGAADIAANRGLTIDLVIDGTGLKEGDVLLDNRDVHGTGIALTVDIGGSVRWTMRDKKDTQGQHEATWNSDPHVLREGSVPLTVIVDAAPKIISFVASGQFCDGNGLRTFGWGRFDTVPTDLSGMGTLTLSPAVKVLRIYNRYLRTNEAVHNHLAIPYPVGLPKLPKQNDSADQRPNIVMILVDDLGYADLGCFGNKEILSPRLDALAKEGKKFTMFRSNSSVCSPTRAALMSGVVPDRVGVPGVIRTQTDHSWGYFSPNIDALPQLLKTAGYHTAHIGKWHLGYESPNIPNDRGFDLFRGFLGDMMDDYYTHLRHGINYMRHNNEAITVQGHATDVFTDWACEYLRSRAGKPEPFFLYLAYNAPHTPIQPKEDWLRRVQSRAPDIPESKAKYMALIEHMDDSVGQVFDVLDEMNIADNTLVFFSSDNGGSLVVGADNGKLRAGKGTMYEGGLRVPTIVRWPQKIKPGTETDVDAYTADLFPTFLEAARCETPVRQSLDGVSLLPVFKGDETEMPKRDFYFVRREGGPPYFGLTCEAVISGNWKLVHHSPVSSLELFNLRDDPYEQTDLSTRESGQYTRMFRLLQRHIQRGGAVPWQQPEGH